MARAERFTIKNKQIEYYSDFATNLDLNPVTGQIVKLVNEDAVINALKNIVLTNFGDRFYNTNKGTNVAGSLFENDNPLLISNLKDKIQLAIKNFEPRAKINSVLVHNNEKQNALYCKVIFTLINIPDTFETDILLKRIR